MIIKAIELKKKINEQDNLILLYGKNDNQKLDIINFLIKKNEFLNFEQNEIIEKKESFFDEIYTKSLFSNKKVIIIKRVSDKILNLIQDINIKKIEDTRVVLIADVLDKKSKLRLKFEKDNNLICAAFYPDNKSTLLQVASDFFRNNKISISYSILNTIIEKINDNRTALLNELEKIKLYSINKKKISNDEIIKLVNLNENISANELVDSCLVKNKKKTIRILNDNNFSNDDCILIIRVFLNRSKTILRLLEEFEKNKNIELTISSAKPPIFWKDKEITKQLILKWESKRLKNLLYEINQIEFLLKKNINNSIDLLTNFILEKVSTNN